MLKLKAGYTTTRGTVLGNVCGLKTPNELCRASPDIRLFLGHPLSPTALDAAIAAGSGVRLLPELSLSWALTPTWHVSESGRARYPSLQCVPRVTISFVNLIRVRLIQRPAEGLAFIRQSVKVGLTSTVTVRLRLRHLTFLLSCLRGKMSVVVAEVVAAVVLKFMFRSKWSTAKRGTFRMIVDSVAFVTRTVTLVTTMSEYPLPLTIGLMNSCVNVVVTEKMSVSMLVRSVLQFRFVRKMSALSPSFRFTMK